MNLKISYRHLESTPSIEEKIRSKTTAHLEKYFQGDCDIKWVCSIDNHRHRSEINVHAGHGHFRAQAEDDCLYKTMDEALAKVERQIREQNKKIKEKIHK